MDPPSRVEGNQLQINFPNLINVLGTPIRLIPILPPINRRYHSRLNAVKEILDPQISKLYFEKVKDELKQKTDNYSNIWTIREIFYPNIFVNVLSTTGKILLIISLNYRNYNYLPPQVGFLTPEEKLVFSLKPDAIKPDAAGMKHIIPHIEGAWACIPGTYEYHDFYFDLDRWELERYDLASNIIELINRIVNMIDRTQDTIIERALP